jgi:putative membrane-bound dehydrogenase-like protein
MRPLGLWLFLLSLIGLNSCKQNSENSLSGFELHSDFSMELTVSEPLVLDPVELHFDETGALYVLEMPGYPFGDVPSRLVRLLDNDEDGTYDTRLVFSDQLGVASSFMPFKQGFLVASPPELLWIADTDKDGVADTRKVIVAGFTNDNLQHNFNGITYGIDNWIYIANGGNSGAPYLNNQPETAIPLRGGDLRLHNNFNELERVGESSGGYKLTFDSWGHLFETHNLEHNLHLVFEDRYLSGVPGQPSHALANISDHESNGLSRVYPIGEQETRVNHPEQSGFFSGSCGITYYGGGIFPQGMESGLFVADVVLNLIHFDHLHSKGSSFSTSRYGERSEFLASTDRAFRPVNFEIGPDGSLYVLDMHREVIEHPEWIPDEIEQELDLNAGKNQGRIYRVWPKTHTSNPKWNFDKTHLVEALGHPNQWVRTTAQRILVTESEGNFGSALSEVLAGSDSQLQRLHALWTLEGRGELSDADLHGALADPIAGIRENALKIAERRIFSNTEFSSAVLERVQDSNARVRLQALLSLVGSGASQDSEYLNDISKVSRQLLEHPETDRWTLRAITATLQPQAKMFLDQELSNWTRGGNWATVINDLIRELGQSASSAVMADFIQQLGAANQVGEVKSGIAALSEGWSTAGRTSEDLSDADRLTLTLALNDLEQRNDRGIVLAVAGLRSKLDLPNSDRLNVLLAQSKAFVLDTLKAADERLEWLQIMGKMPFSERSSTLISLLDSRVPNTLQREVLKQLWDSNSSQVPELLFGVWDRLGPDSRKYATNMLLYKEDYHESLLSAMESGTVKLGEFNLDLERRRTLLFSDRAEIRHRAEQLFSDAGVVQRAQVIQEFKPAITLAGDPANGKKLFGGLCASCHKIGSLGVEVGPSLADIGRKSKQTLLYDILDPNAAVDTEYLAHTVIDETGTLNIGVVLRETDDEVALLLPGGVERTFRKSRIRRFNSSGLSLMPEGLEQGLTPQELSDLLAFLQANR